MFFVLSFILLKLRTHRAVLLSQLRRKCVNSLLGIINCAKILHLLEQQSTYFELILYILIKCQRSVETTELRVFSLDLQLSFLHFFPSLISISFVFSYSAFSFEKMNLSKVPDVSIRTEHVTKYEYKTFSKGLIFYLYIISSCRCRDQRTTTINIIDSKQPAITKFMVAQSLSLLFYCFQKLF